MGERIEGNRDVRQPSSGQPRPRRDLRNVAVTTVMSHPVLATTASASFPDALHALVTHGPADRR